MISVALRTVYLIHSDISKNVPPTVKKRIGKIYQTGFITFLAGFAIWNVDNTYYSTSTEWKKAVGWPTAFLLEGTSSFWFPCRTLLMDLRIGHSWWHGLTVLAVSSSHNPVSISPDRTGRWLVLDDTGDKL